MSANHFQITGDRIDSQAEFFRREENGVWRNLLYYPETLESESRSPVVLNNKTFLEVSFKDTDVNNVRFINCKFIGCLFIGATLNDCEFTNCSFKDTNTSKIKIRNCLFDPKCFEDNFDLINDTNIAIDLYHSLYRNASEEHQPEHALNSLYQMKKAENAHLDSQKNRKKITKKEYLKKKAGHLIYDFVSGYGLKTSRVLRLLLIVIGSFAVINYVLSSWIFPATTDLSFIDSIYFTCVTISTLGYGDITPVTSFGRLWVTAQALTGFVVLSIFLAAVANTALRAR